MLLPWYRRARRWLDAQVGSGQMMSELIPSALERKQPAVFLSGPSFAKEVMQNRPTGVVAACKDAKLARTVQALFASPTMRVNTTTDVVGAGRWATVYSGCWGCE